MFRYTEMPSNIYKVGNKIFNLNNISCMEFRENTYDQSKSYVNIIEGGSCSTIDMTKTEFDDLNSLIFNGRNPHDI
jgi:hypothetical protein